MDLSVYLSHREPSQAKEDILHPTMPLDSSLKTQILVDKTIMSGSGESFSQSPPSDQLLSSLPFHEFQKSVNIATLTGCEMLLNTEQYKEHTLHEAQSPQFLKPHISRYSSKAESPLKGATQFWDSCSSTSIYSQSHSPLISVQCQSPAFPVSSNPNQSVTHPECFQTRSNTLNHPLPSKSEEDIECQTKSLNLSQQYFKPANETMLSQFSQSPPSDKLSSFNSHECQKSDISAILNSSAPASITSYRQGEHTLQKATSPRHNDFNNPPTAKGPSSSQSKSVVDWDSSMSLSLQSHSPLRSSSTEFLASFMPELSPISPKDHCTVVHAKTPNPPLSRPIQAEDDKNMLTQYLQSPRLVDFHRTQTPRSPLKATSTQSLDSSLFPQFHDPSPSTLIQCSSPVFSISSRLKLSPTPSELYHIRAKALTPLSTKSSSQTQNGNTPSESQPPSELKKSPLSAEHSSSDDEEPYILSLGSSSAKSEILQSSPPLHLNSSSEYK